MATTLRSCGTCTLCCKVMAVPALKKPRNVWCEHCDHGRGCKIYEKRPQACQDFLCAYLTDPGLDERWRPTTARFVLAVHERDRIANVHVDPERPDSWRREPYLSAFRMWSRTAAERFGYLAVAQKERTIVVLPDGEVDLGVVAPDEVIMSYTEQTPTGVRYRAIKLKRSATSQTSP